MKNIKQFICGIFKHPYRHWREQNGQMIIYCLDCNKILSTHKIIGGHNG